MINESESQLLDEMFEQAEILTLYDLSKNICIERTYIKSRHSLLRLLETTEYSGNKSNASNILICVLH